MSEMDKPPHLTGNEVYIFETVHDNQQMIHDSIINPKDRSLSTEGLHMLIRGAENVTVTRTEENMDIEVVPLMDMYNDAAVHEALYGKVSDARAFAARSIKYAAMERPFDPEHITFLGELERKASVRVQRSNYLGVLALSGMRLMPEIPIVQTMKRKLALKLLNNRPRSLY